MTEKKKEEKKIKNLGKVMGRMKNLARAVDNGALIKLQHMQPEKMVEVD